MTLASSFKNDDNFNIVKNHLLVSNISFKILDISKLDINTLNYNNNDVIIIYIDGIDLEYSKYLIIKRNEFFENL
mgnify:CR=1 FL=1